MKTQMRKRFVVLLGIVGLTLAGCTPNLGQNARYGMYGGQQQRSSLSVEKPFTLAETFLGMRWFPAHVRFSPDDSNLLVSLCHINPQRSDVCRIGRYYLASQQWEVLPFEDKRTYRWPTYTPDGKWIVFSTGPCDEQYRCSIGDYVLARMPSDGARMEVVADTIAREPSFAPDGKKLVYWKLRPRVEHLYEMDWETRQERELVNMASAPASETGRPFLIEDGKAVAFYGRINVGFEHRGLIRFDIADRPLRSAYDLDRLKVIWPGRKSDVPHSGVADVFDIAQDGRLLFRARISDIKPNGGDWAALFLGTPRVDASDDTTAFDVQSCFAATIAFNGKKVAFLKGGTSGGVHPPDARLGLIGVGEWESEEVYVDWPRLELKSGRIYSANQIKGVSIN